LKHKYLLTLYNPGADLISTVKSICDDLSPEQVSIDTGIADDIIKKILVDEQGVELSADTIKKLQDYKESTDIYVSIKNIKFIKILKMLDEALHPKVKFIHQDYDGEMIKQAAGITYNQIKEIKNYIQTIMNEDENDTNTN